MYDVNIEFCHIYADQHIGEDHTRSISVLRDLEEFSKKEGKSYVSSVLIDDYNAAKSLWERDTFERALGAMNVKPDILGYESACIDGANHIMSQLPKSSLCTERFRKENKEVVFLIHEGHRVALKSTLEGQTRYTCSLLGASWHGGKLGLVKNPFIKTKVAHTAITILPECLRDVEENMKVILSYLDANISDRMRNIYLS